MSDFVVPVNYHFKSGDRLPEIRAVITDGNESEINLSTYTSPTFIANNEDLTLKFTGAATIDADQATNTGQIYYILSAGDSAWAAGHYLGVFQVTDASGRRITAPSVGYIDLYVDANLATS